MNSQPICVALIFWLYTRFGPSQKGFQATHLIVRRFPPPLLSFQRKEKKTLDSRSVEDYKGSLIR